MKVAKNSFFAVIVSILLYSFIWLPTWSWFHDLPVVVIGIGYFYTPFVLGGVNVCWFSRNNSIQETILTLLMVQSTIFVWLTLFGPDGSYSDYYCGRFELVQREHKVVLTGKGISCFYNDLFHYAHLFWKPIGAISILVITVVCKLMKTRVKRKGHFAFSDKTLTPR